MLISRHVSITSCGVSDSLAVNIQTLELYVLRSNPYFTPQDRYVTLEKFPRSLTAVTSFTVSGQYSLPPVGVDLWMWGPSELFEWALSMLWNLKGIRSGWEKQVPRREPWKALLGPWLLCMLCFPAHLPRHEGLRPQKPGTKISL